MKEKTPRIFLGAQKVSEHLVCSICRQVFDNPNRLGCGHTFCYLCIQQWAGMSKLCPLCKKSLRHRKPQKDLVASSIIDDLQSKCSHQKCIWTGVYSRLKRHQRVCQHRSRKAFQSKDLDQIVDLNDDSQVKQMMQINKNGKKRQKQQFQNLPAFPSSPQQQSHQNYSLNMNATLRIQDRHRNANVNSNFYPNSDPNNSFNNNTLNISDQSPANHSNTSSSNSNYLEIRPQQLILNRVNKDPRIAFLCRNSKDMGNNHFTANRIDINQSNSTKKQIRPTLPAELRNMNYDDGQYQIDLRQGNQDISNNTIRGNSQNRDNLQANVNIYAPNLWSIQNNQNKKATHSGRSSSSSFSSNPFDGSFQQSNEDPMSNQIIIINSQSDQKNEQQQQNQMHSSRESGQMSSLTLPVVKSNDNQDISPSANLTLRPKSKMHKHQKTI